MAASSSPITSPKSSSSLRASSKSSPPSSVYLDAAESLTENLKIQPDPLLNNNSVIGRHYNGARRTSLRTSWASSMSNSTHGKPPYPAQKPKSKSRIAKSQPERYVYNGSMNDNAMNIIIEQLEANLETYTEVQAQEAFDLSRASRGVIHAEEMYTIERLVEGRVQMRALENKAVEVKNRLRIADLQLTLLTRRLESYGFILSDENPQDFIGRLQTKPLLHAQLTASNVAQLSSLPPDTPPTATDLILQEPISKLDISTWTRGTPEFHIPNDESSTSVLREDTGSELAGAPVI